MYFYKNSLIGLYFTDTELDSEELFDERINECDMYIGYAENADEARELILKRTKTCNGPDLEVLLDRAFG